MSRISYSFTFPVSSFGLNGLAVWTPLGMRGGRQGRKRRPL
jgi:hypothetical protein